MVNWLVCFVKKYKIKEICRLWIKHVRLCYCYHLSLSLSYSMAGNYWFCTFFHFLSMANIFSFFLLTLLPACSIKMFICWFFKFILKYFSFLIKKQFKFHILFMRHGVFMNQLGLRFNYITFFFLLWIVTYESNIIFNLKYTNYSCFGILF